MKTLYCWIGVLDFIDFRLCIGPSGSCYALPAKTARTV